jgi:hypothetical protein
MWRRNAENTAWDELSAGGSVTLDSLTYYVDSSTGSDANDGFSLATALASIGELCRRWGPQPTLSNVLVYVLATDVEPSNPPALDLVLAGNVEFVDYYAAQYLDAPSWMQATATITGATNQSATARTTPFVLATAGAIYPVAQLSFASGHRAWSYFEQVVAGANRMHTTPFLDDTGSGAPPPAGTSVRSRSVVAAPFATIRVRGNGTLGFYLLRVRAQSIEGAFYSSMQFSDCLVDTPNGTPVVLVGLGSLVFENCLFSTGLSFRTNRPPQFTGGGSISRVVVGPGADVDTLPGRIWDALYVSGRLYARASQALGESTAVTGGIAVGPGGVLYLPPSSALFAAPSDSVFNAVPTITLTPNASLLWSSPTLGAQLYWYGFAAFLDAAHASPIRFFALDVSGSAPALTGARTLSIANIDAPVSAGGFGGAPVSLNAGIRVSRADSAAMDNAGIYG